MRRTLGRTVSSGKKVMGATWLERSQAMHSCEIAQKELHILVTGRTADSGTQACTTLPCTMYFANPLAGVILSYSSGP